MNKTSTNKKAGQKPTPRTKWQTGDYERNARFQFLLPYQFLLLCRLMDVTPEQVLVDFMDNLSCSSWKRDGRDEAREHLVAYFLSHGYGQHQYSKEEIRQIFHEMNAMGLLFPRHGSSKMIDHYARWRDKHHHYWFKYWFKKPRRKLQTKG